MNVATVMKGAVRVWVAWVQMGGHERGVVRVVASPQLSALARGAAAAPPRPSHPHTPPPHVHACPRASARLLHITSEDHPRVCVRQPLGAPLDLAERSVCTSALHCFLVTPTVWSCHTPTSAMVLFLIGLGLGDESDITLKGLTALRSCSHVFLEEYTAILTGTSKQQLQAAYRCVDITTADREMVESGAELILAHAQHSNVAFLVVGDPFASAPSPPPTPIHPSLPLPHPAHLPHPPPCPPSPVGPPPTTICSCARRPRA